MDLKKDPIDFENLIKKTIPASLQHLSLENIPLAFIKPFPKLAKQPIKQSVVPPLSFDTMIPQSERVSRLKECLDTCKMNHELRILQLSTLKDAHVYCLIYNLSAQQFGPLLEKFILVKYSYNKNKSRESCGDCFKDGKNSEIKVSLGGKNHNKFNFVQIRPFHDCQTYILTAYHLCNENIESEGELFVFKISKEEMKKILVTHGSYAHGTMKENGSITLESLEDLSNKKEYALRPYFNDSCWKTLLNFRIEEIQL